MKMRAVASPLISLMLCAGLVGIGATPPSPTPAPIATPSPLVQPTGSPSPGPTPSTTPTPLATPTILMLPPDAPPQILWFSLSSATPHAGDVISGVVLTSSNVASVEIRVGGFSVNLPKTDVGHFEGTYRIPQIPFFVSHNLVMLIIARNTAGEAVQSSLPFQVR